MQRLSLGPASSIHGKNWTAQPLCRLCRPVLYRCQRCELWLPSKPELYAHTISVRGSFKTNWFVASRSSSTLTESELPHLLSWLALTPHFSPSCSSLLNHLWSTRKLPECSCWCLMASPQAFLVIYILDDDSQCSEKLLSSFDARPARIQFRKQSKIIFISPKGIPSRGNITNIIQKNICNMRVCKIILWSLCNVKLHIDRALHILDMYL